MFNIVSSFNCDNCEGIIVNNLTVDAIARQKTCFMLKLSSSTKILHSYLLYSRVQRKTSYVCMAYVFIEFIEGTIQKAMCEHYSGNDNVCRCLIQKVTRSPMINYYKK